MIQSSATDGELRQIVRLQMTDRRREADEVLSRITKRDEAECRRAARAEVEHAYAVAERHAAKLQNLSRFAWALAGIVAAIEVLFGLNAHGIEIPIWLGVVVTFALGLTGGVVGYLCGR